MPPPEDSIHRILAGQRKFFRAGGTRDIGERLESLRLLEESLVGNRQDLLDALASDLGKPAVEAALSEHVFLVQEIRQVRRSLRKWLRRQRAGHPFYFLPCRSRVHREPYGTALIIAPWNYPIQLSLAPLVSAIAAGNTVILKPSELAPASEAFLSRIVATVFPPEWATVVPGGPEVPETLLEEGVDLLFFTGSTEVGRLIAQKAARRLTPCVLELGGKCPCVVDRDTDLDLAARRILIGKLFNAGQTCFAPDFVAVHEAVRDDLVAALARLLDERPWEREMARIVNRRHYDRLRALLKGNEIRAGEDDPDRLHLAPRILPRADWDHPTMREEIFGPILPVLGFHSLDELIERLRTRPTPLALYGFSRDQRFVRELLQRVPSGGVCINDVGKQAMNLHLPFGGSGASGHGRYRGRHGVETFSQQRAVTRRFFLPDPFELLPPRSRAEWMLRRWLR